jgi:aminopeptidase-like protein
MQEAPAPSVSGQPHGATGVGEEMLELMRVLYPLCRSLTGDGVRETLRLVGEVLPLEITEVATGTPIFDWTVPREWNITDAWISDTEGRRIVDFRESNLHVVGYSTPVRRTMRGSELRDRLHVHPEHPEWVPARTAYWADTWGFCVTDAQLRAIQPDEEYEVCIDSRLDDGHLTYAEAVIPGRTENEVLLSTYICHPSLCNDNLSGIAVLAFAGRELRRRDLRYTYRLLFSPGTVGPLTWLARNHAGLDRIGHGVVVACVGDPGHVTYKRSRRGQAEVDRAAEHVLRHSRPDAVIEDFVPWGGDERQFCSPGFDLPTGALTRSAHGMFPEYHSSADNFDLVTGESLADSLDALLAILDLLERNTAYLSRSPYGEPQLGRRGLYGQISSGAPRAEESFQRAILWVLNLADGQHSLLDVAERADLPFAEVARAADALVGADLLEELPG